MREAARTRQLRDQSFVSEERVDKAESEAKARQAACDSARAQVKEAQARTTASRADTARTVVRAPFDGIVAEVNGEVGEFLTPSPPGIPTCRAKRCCGRSWRRTACAAKDDGNRCTGILRVER